MNSGKKTKAKTTKKDLTIKIATTITTAVITILIIFFVFLPQILSIKNNLEKLRNLKDKRLFLEKQITLLNSVDEQTLSTLYQETLKGLPTDINLGQLGEYIDKNTQKYNLEIATLSLTEELTVEKETHDTLGIKHRIKRVVIPVNAKGEKEDLIRFIRFLINNPYIFTFDTVHLSKLEVDPTAPIARYNNPWTLRVEIVQYTMPYLDKIPIDFPLKPIQP